MSASTLGKAISETIDGSLACGRFRVQEIAEQIMQEFPELIEEAQIMLLEGHLRKLIKAQLKSRLDMDADQDTLPGLRLPLAIMVREGEDLYYVNSAKATWAELCAALDERGTNLGRITAQYDAFTNIKNRLQPWMEGNPTMTVAEALAIEQQQAA